MAHLPVMVFLCGALDDPALDDAVLELGEADLLVVARDDGAQIRLTAERDSLLSLLGNAPVPVKPFEMDRVMGVLLALQPVARQFGDPDVRVAVLVGEGLPHGDERSGSRPHVCPQHAAEFLHGVTRDLDLLLETSVRVDGLLEGLLDALAGLVHHPAVVHAAQAMLLRYAVGEIDPAMRAGAFDESERAGLVAVEDEVLPEQAHSLGGALVELGGRGEGMPVTTHQFAHRRASPDLCQ